MDDKKDNRTSDNKDTLQAKDGFYKYVSLKAEKITSALYMVTDFLSDNEPLKWRLRGRSLDLAGEANALLKDKKNFFGVTGLGRLLGAANDIVTLLDVAYVGGTVSQMNFEILRREYIELARAIEEKMYSEPLKKYISDESLGLFQPRPELDPKRLWGGDAPSPASGDSSRPAAKNFRSPAPSPAASYKGQKDSKKDTESDLYGLNRPDEKKSVRKEQIINFLKDKDWMTINEISRALPDCGLKTVQRELLDMVGRGILAKQGERRWSRYRIVTK